MCGQVKSWFQHSRPDREVLLIPVNINANHWILVCVHHTSEQKG